MTEETGEEEVDGFRGEEGTGAGAVLTDTDLEAGEVESGADVLEGADGTEGGPGDLLVGGEFWEDGQSPRRANLTQQQTAKQTATLKGWLPNCRLFAVCHCLLGVQLPFVGTRTPIAIESSTSYGNHRNCRLLPFAG